MDFDKIFNKAFRYPLNLNLFLILFIFSLFASLPTTVYNYSYIPEAFSISQLKELLMLFIPIWIISFFVGNFLAAFFFDSASRYFPKMKHGKLKDSFKTAKKRYISLLGTQILFFIILAFIFLFLSGLFIVFLFVNPTIFLFGILIGALAAVITAFFLFFCSIACVLDKLNPVDSLKRSFNLVKVNKLNTLVFWIILIIIAIIIGFIGALPSLIYSFSMGSNLQSLNSKFLFFVIIQFIFGTYLGLFIYSAQVNYYRSLKKETKLISRARVKKGNVRKKKRKR
jgi:hypothetical protein